jgi:hypothetical protein
MAEMAGELKATSAPVRGQRGWRPSHSLAWTFVSILPLWVVAFVSLQLVAGTGGPPPAPKTLVEAAGQYSDISTPGWIGWCLFAYGILVFTAFAVLWLARAVRGLPGGRVATWLAAAAAVYGVVSGVVGAYVSIGLKVSDPPSYPPLIERFALDVMDAKAWDNALSVFLFVAAIGVAAWALSRERVLGQTAPVVVVLAAAFALLAIVLPIPMLPAILLGVLGVGLLRSLQSESV